MKRKKVNENLLRHRNSQLREMVFSAKKSYWTSGSPGVHEREAQMSRSVVRALREGSIGEVFARSSAVHTSSRAENRDH